MKYSKTREELLLKLINRTEPKAVNGLGCCQYSHAYNGGCAIGCDISQKLAIELDFLPDTGVSEDKVLGKLPRRLQNMGKSFLVSVQTIHDIYLGTPAFTSEVNKVIDRFDLNLEHI